MLLGLLERGPAHGYLLQQAYDSKFGKQRPVKRAQVYSTPSRLHRDGQVTVVGNDRDGGPDRTWYALTRDEVTALESWIDTPEQATPYLQSTVYQKVADRGAGHPGRRAGDGPAGGGRPRAGRLGGAGHP